MALANVGYRVNRHSTRFLPHPTSHIRSRIADHPSNEPTSVANALHCILTTHTGAVHNDTDLHATSSRLEQRARIVAGDPARFHQDPFAAILELEIRRLEVDHQVPPGLAQPDHRAG